MRISLDDLKRGGYDLGMLPPEKVVEAPPGRWRVEIPGWIYPEIRHG